MSGAPCELHVWNQNSGQVVGDQLFISLINIHKILKLSYLSTYVMCISCALWHRLHAPLQS